MMIEPIPTDSVRSILARLGRLGVPVFVQNVCMTTGSFTSTVLVGHLAEGTESDGNVHKIAALGMGFVFCNILGFHMLNGLAGAIDTLSSQAFGAGDTAAVGHNFRRALLILGCVADLPLALMWCFSERLLLLGGQDPTVAALVGTYSLIRIPALLCQTVSIASSLDNCKRVSDEHKNDEIAVVTYVS